ncbi:MULTISPECIES: MDR family MFS transporter [Methanobacterium]|jgi:EmrB/QacA subfamily drug resistance transporter|uniref:MDR family MFS transporter n=1 Tax=Methanobacterium veterum TaxID=408577 RepID=A0A9E5DQR2_9EURY|nr:MULTISPECIES: MDR family MFS transporter [Methanobacterium]MCZ3367025.1 MDR family MFS transporter [Methanobacterium veterum]MCZ3373828.1 MDR family MFS transporter [Methanobacterium veterum]
MNHYKTRYDLSKDKIIMIMAGLMVGLLVAALDNSIISTAMPKVINNLQGMEYYVWPFTSYMLSSTIAIILFGKLSDIYGRKLIIIFGIILFVITSILCGLSNNIFELILFRGLQGIGGGILLSLPFILVGEIFSPKERGKYMGILASVFGISSVLGPILGGVITDAVGWRWIFFVNVPVGIAAVSILMYSLPNFKLDGVKKVIDYSGIITFTLALTGLFLALTLARDLNSYPMSEIVGLLIFSAVMFVLFIWAEKRAIEPILPLKLFNNSIFTISSLENFLASALIFAGIIYVPLFAQNILGMSATNAGFLMIPMLISLTIASNIAGQIISRTGKYKKLAIAEFVITGIGIALLATLDVNSSPYALLAYSTILGLGSGMMYTVFTISVQNSFSLREIGIVTASMQFFRNVGSTVAIPVFGYIVNATLASSAVVNLGQKEALAISIQNVFLVSIALAFAGLVIAFFLKEASLNHESSAQEIQDNAVDEAK